MLAAKSQYPPSLGGQASSGIVTGLPTPSSAYAPSRRVLIAPTATNQSFASPTDSEFSDAEDPDPVRNWDEDRVCEYLRSVKCGDYEKMFRKNHINGENLLEMDKEVLKEMGIEKVGDRVRLFLSIKKLRTKAYANQKKRNRVCSPPCFLILSFFSCLYFLPSAPHFLFNLVSHFYRNLLAVWTSNTHPQAPPRTSETLVGLRRRLRP